MESLFQRASAKPRPRRRSSRLAVDLAASLRQHGRSAQGARIEDLSRHGCAANGYGFVHPGARVWIRLPGFASLPGRIAWCREDRAGIAFDQPLDPAFLIQFVAGRFDLRALPESAAVRRATPPCPANDSLPPRRKLQPGPGMEGLIHRQIVRQTNYRFEQRFSGPESIGTPELEIDGKPARVIDISASGLKLAVELDTPIGEQVTIDFGGFDALPGRLVWRRDGQAGISLPPQSLDLRHLAN